MLVSAIAAYVQAGIIGGYGSSYSNSNLGVGHGGYAGYGGDGGYGGAVLGHGVAIAAPVVGHGYAGHSNDVDYYVSIIFKYPSIKRKFSFYTRFKINFAIH